MHTIRQYVSNRMKEPNSNCKCVLCTKIKRWSESTAISGGEIMIKVATDVDLEYFFFVRIIDQGIHSVECWMLRSIECGWLAV